LDSSPPPLKTKVKQTTQPKEHRKRTTDSKYFETVRFSSSFLLFSPIASLQHLVHVSRPLKNMKNSLALTTAALTGLSVQIVLAQTGGPLIPAKLNVVVPKGPMQLGALVLRKQAMIQPC
jgi:hypothetical protein